MQAKEMDLQCYRGQTWVKDLYLKYKATGQPLDLTGVVVKSQIRPWQNSTTLSAEMTATVYPANGMVTLELSAEQTSKLSPKVYQYDVKLTDANDNVIYCIFGKFTVIGRVTV